MAPWGKRVGVGESMYIPTLGLVLELDEELVEQVGGGDSMRFEETLQGREVCATVCCTIPGEHRDSVGQGAADRVAAARFVAPPGVLPASAELMLVAQRERKLTFR